MYNPTERIVHKEVLYGICGALAGMGNSSIGPSGGIDLITHCTMSGNSTTELHPVSILNRIHL